jgi:hypothetical protein
MDQDPECLREGLMGLRELRWMALRCPRKYGGLECSELEYCEFRELSARYSGALAFLQAQHQSAVSVLALSKNKSLKEEYLPQIAEGEKLLGVGVTHLRHNGNSSLYAEPTKEGYLLNGRVPWVTGFGFYPEFIVGAMLPENQCILGVVPFRSFSGENASIKVSDPVPLMVARATNTVQVFFKDWLLPHEKVVAVQKGDWVEKQDRQNILKLGFLALGCARGSLDYLQKAYQKFRLKYLLRAWKTLSAELSIYRDAILLGIRTPGTYTFKQKLVLRAKIIELAARCAHAAITTSGGAASLVHHPAQRLYREALLYTVAGQTPAIRASTLESLIHL